MDFTLRWLEEERVIEYVGDAFLLMTPIIRLAVLNTTKAKDNY